MISLKTPAGCLGCVVIEVLHCCASGADFAAVSGLRLCFLFSKPMGQKNRKLPFLCTEDSRSGGHQVNTLLSLSAEAPVSLSSCESKQIA